MSSFVAWWVVGGRGVKWCYLDADQVRVHAPVGNFPSLVILCPLHPHQGLLGHRCKRIHAELGARLQPEPCGDFHRPATVDGQYLVPRRKATFSFLLFIRNFLLQAGILRPFRFSTPRSAVRSWPLPFPPPSTRSALLSIPPRESRVHDETKHGRVRDPDCCHWGDGCRQGIVYLAGHGTQRSQDWPWHRLV